MMFSPNASSDDPLVSTAWGLNIKSVIDISQGFGLPHPIEID